MSLCSSIKEETQEDNRTYQMPKQPYSQLKNLSILLRQPQLRRLSFKRTVAQILKIYIFRLLRTKPVFSEASS